MTTKPKILVIDDDRDFLASVRSILESNDYAVVEAESGKLGLEMLVEHKPDAIVLDIMMETTTEGYSVTNSIKLMDEYKDVRNTPIVMVSSIEKSPEERFPLSEGYVDTISPGYYLTKPLDIPKFLETLEKVLEK